MINQVEDFQYLCSKSISAENGAVIGLVNAWLGTQEISTIW